MGITRYEPAPVLADECYRERAVEALGALALSGDRTLHALVDELRRTMRTAMAAVSIIHRDWQYVIAGSGLPDGPYSRRTSFCGHAIEHPDALFCILDAALDPRFAENPGVDGGLGVRFYAAAPLVARSGVAYGVVCAFDPHPRAALSEVDARRLHAAAATTMTVIAAHAPTVAVMAS